MAFGMEPISPTKSAARIFVESKGRLPKDYDELVEWLLEFDADCEQAISKYHDLLVEHTHYLFPTLIILPKEAA